MAIRVLASMLAVVLAGTVGSRDVVASTDGPFGATRVQNLELYKSTGPRPAFRWQDGQGKPVSLADYAGKVVLLNIWATWCVPCIRELPTLDRLNTKLGSDKFAVVALNIDKGGRPAAKKLINRLKLKTLALNLDPSWKIARKLNVKVLPSTFIYDARGRVLGRLEGPVDWEAMEAADLLQYFIDNPEYAASLPSISIGRIIVE